MELEDNAQDPELAKDSPVLVVEVHWAELRGAILLRQKHVLTTAHFGSRDILIQQAHCRELIET